MLRVCASVNSLEEIQNTKGADLMEVSIDTFRQMTEMLSSTDFGGSSEGSYAAPHHADCPIAKYSLLPTCR